MLTLYGHPFSRAHRVLWMLKELNLEFEHVPTGFQDGGCKTPAFLAINPNGRVPVLVDDGQAIFESLAINLHLVHKFAGPLSPATPWETSLSLQWSFWVVTEIEKPLLFAAANLALFETASRRDDELQLALQRLARPFAVLNAHLARQPFLLGDRFSVADLNVAAVMTLVAIAQVPLDAYPALQRWFWLLMERPAAADWKPIHFTVPRPTQPLGLLAMFL